MAMMGPLGGSREDADLQGKCGRVRESMPFGGSNGLDCLSHTRPSTATTGNGLRPPVTGAPVQIAGGAAGAGCHHHGHGTHCGTPKSAMICRSNGLGEPLALRVRRWTRLPVMGCGAPRLERALRRIV